MQKIALLLVALTFGVSYGFSQVVSVEIVGKDTFPTVIVYDGVPVSVFTDSQTTTIAHAFQDRDFYKQQLDESAKFTTQYISIIAQQDIDMAALKQKVDSVNLQFRLSEQNQANLQTSLKAAADKEKAQKKKFILSMGTSIVSSFIVGVVVTTAYFIIRGVK